MGDDTYKLTSVSGSQSGYTAVWQAWISRSRAHPVYYDGPAGGVTRRVPGHFSTICIPRAGTISMGSGWTIEHNNIHDSYGKPGEGVAFYGGDESTR